MSDIPTNVRERARDLVESYANGNRTHVRDTLIALASKPPTAEGLAIALWVACNMTANEREHLTAAIADTVFYG